jgi:hypothetical protein
VAAVAGADAMVHLAGTLRPKRPNSYQAANPDTVAATVSALRRAAAKRVVFLSYLDAGVVLRPPTSRDTGRSGADGRIPAVRRRQGGVRAGLGQPAVCLGREERRRRALVHAALDPTAPPGTFELAGPEPLAVDELVRHDNGPQVRIRHVPVQAARLLGRLVTSLPAPRGVAPDVTRGGRPAR